MITISAETAMTRATAPAAWEFSEGAVRFAFATTHTFHLGRQVTTLRTALGIVGKTLLVGIAEIGGWFWFTAFDTYTLFTHLIRLTSAHPQRGFTAVM